MGDTDAVKKANDLAIACETDKALMAVDRAAKSGGLGAGIADLQRVVILRDAGRMSEADAAMAERNERAGADAQAAAEAERAVSKSLEELRAERQKQTGRRICP
jgi:purine nucleoside permease